MGVIVSSRKRTVDHKISVKTGDRKGAGSDANIHITLLDDKGKKSLEICLNSFLRNDFERGRVDHFHSKCDATKFGAVSVVEVWRDDANLDDDWFCDTIEVELLGSKETRMFPIHRWIPPNKRLRISRNDMILPQHDQMSIQRKEELDEKKCVYQLECKVYDLIPQVKDFPKDESFSNDYLWDIATNAVEFKVKAKIAEFKADSWKSLEDIEELYNSDVLQRPAGIQNWRSDKEFGNQRLSGCNPTQIRLCTKIPENFAVKDEDLRPILEGLTIAEAIDKKRLFIVDHGFLKDLPCTNQRKICAPTALFFVNKEKNLMPVAIQLFPEPADDNPVFFPTDPEYTWLLAKLNFNNADASVHQSASHLGLTHLLIEAVAVATHRSLSPSHPLFRLLAPHFLYLMAINNLALGALVSKGGWVDKTMIIGRDGMFEIIRRSWKNWRLDTQGCVPKDLEDRGVADPEVLPNYHYRDDALLLHKAIYDYVKAIVDHYYDSPEMVRGDIELQEWGRTLAGDDSGDVAVNMKGVPNNGKFETAHEVADTITNFIFISSVGHAAANFGQYDEYGFPPNYPAWLHGDIPCDKKPRTEADIIAQLPDKEETVSVVAITKMLSEKGTNSLGDFEVQYIYDPIALKALEKFRSDLKKIGTIIDERNKTRETEYPYLHPSEVPNAISI